MECDRGAIVRGTVLNEALRIINGERQSMYGDPEDSFDLICGYWKNYLRGKGIPADKLSAADVMMMMVLFKIAREANQGSVDNIVDGAGYFGLYADAAYANNTVKISSGGTFKQ